MDPDQNNLAAPGRQAPGSEAAPEGGRRDGAAGGKFNQAWAAAGAIFIIHAALLLHVFGGPAKLLSAEPVIRDDHAWHLYCAIACSRFLEEHGSTWGYDPNMMAGFPLDVGDISDHLLKVCFLALKSLPPETAYKLIIFFLGAISPFLFMLAAHWYGLSRREVIWSCLLGTWAFWTAGSMILYATGMVGFPLAILYGMAFAALFDHVLRRPSTGGWLGLAAAAPVALLIHPGIVPILGVPCAVFYLLRFRGMPLRRHLLIAAIAAESIILNLFWIYPLTFNLAYALPPHINLRGPWFIISFMMLPPLRQGQTVLPLLIVAGALGLRHAYQPRPEFRPAIAASLLAMGFIGVPGCFTPGFQHIEPARYCIAFVLFLVFPAAITLDRWACGPIRGKRRAWGKWLVAALVAPSLAVFLVITFRLRIQPPFVGMGEQVKSIVAFLSSQTSPDARVLLEDNGPLHDVYDHSYASLPIAYYSRRELIGGPQWAAHFKAHYADLSGVILFGKPVMNWDEKSLRRMMDLYNIGWAGARSPLCLDMFNKFPGLFTSCGGAGGLKFYKVNRAPTFFIEGTGRASADYNLIRLRDVSAPTGRAVISFHYHCRFVAHPPARLVPVMIGGDPVGFIGIIDPPPDLDLAIRYW